MKYNSINFFSYLIYLLPLSLVTGPLIPEITILVCNIFFLIKTLGEKDYSYFKNSFFKLFLVFWLLFNLSTIFSDAILYSLKYSLSYLRFGIFVLAINYLIDKNNKFIQHFYYFLFGTIIFILLDSYFQFLFSYNILGFERPTNYIVSGFFNDEEILGTYLMRLSPLLISLYFFLSDEQRLKFNSYLIYIAIIFPMIFLSGQRTPFFLSTIFLVSSLILLNIDKKKILSLIFSLTIIFTNIFIDKKVYDGIGTGYKNRMITDIIYNQKLISAEQKKRDRKI